MYKKTIVFEYKTHFSAKFPYDNMLSKNRKFTRVKKFSKTKIPNREHEQAKSLIERKFAELTKDVIFEKKPLLVVIEVIRKTNSSDAHNFVEGICDALQEGIGLDDRYFHVYSSPGISKNPMVTVEIYQ